MKKVTFEVNAPGAKMVYLAGDFTQWQEQPKKMTRKRNQDGVFSTSMALGPGTYQYKYIVDGEWRDDPQAAACVNEFGTQNSVVSVA